MTEGADAWTRPRAASSVFWDQAVDIWSQGRLGHDRDRRDRARDVRRRRAHLAQAPAQGLRRGPRADLARWIDQPEEREGPIGDLLDTVTDGHESRGDDASCSRQVRTPRLRPFERDLRVMKVCVSAAPLVGLLGTVTGMLATFARAVRAARVATRRWSLVAGGISEALITTETGLVIALPGLFFQYQMLAEYERYKAFLAHLQTVCTQQFYPHGDAPAGAARHRLGRVEREIARKSSAPRPRREPASPRTADL